MGGYQRTAFAVMYPLLVINGARLAAQAEKSYGACNGGLEVSAGQPRNISGPDGFQSY